MKVDDFRYNPQAMLHVSDFRDALIDSESFENDRKMHAKRQWPEAKQWSLFKRVIRKTFIGMKTMVIRIPKRTTFYTLMTLVIIYTVWRDDVSRQHIFPHQLAKEAGAVTTIGLIMGLLLAFRTNTAYDRWWEGRKLFGQLVNDVRNMGLKARNYLCTTEEQRREFANLLIAFPYALRDHLRGERPERESVGIGPFCRRCRSCSSSDR